MAKGKRAKRAKKSKKNYLIALIVAIVVVIALLGFFVYKVLKPDTLLDGYSFYETGKYKVQYKSDWSNTVDESTPNMTVFLSPDELGIINIITQELTEEYTLDKYVDDSIATLKSNLNLTDGDIGKEKLSIKAKSAYRISYNANDITRITQTIFLSNGAAYIISYNSNIDYFDVYHNMEDTLVMK